ncbi:MAG: hypothetical protein HC859_11365 [Bacteroidia bacterium]|nr:hypothetical protein [Bacteroidia bacterium]
MTLKQKSTTPIYQKVKAAVRSAEAKISGEIVPVIVESSGRYIVANYRASMVLATLVFLMIIVFDRYFPALAVYDPLSILAIVLLGGGVGGLIPIVLPQAKRALLSQGHLDRVTRQRAETIFLEEEVFNTRHRTGIMIFLSLFEHEVIVMADRGISKVVDQKTWDKLVADLVTMIGKGKMIDGLESAIDQCGHVLLDKGF